MGGDCSIASTRCGRKGLSPCRWFMPCASCREGGLLRTRWNVTVGRRLWWGGATLAGLRRRGQTPFEPAPTVAEDPAAIIFTSGSTGPAKGVLYRHGNFDHQVHGDSGVLRHSAGRDRRPLLPAVRPVQRSDGSHDGHSRYRRQPPGPRRSEEADRDDRRLAGNAELRIAGRLGPSRPLLRAAQRSGLPRSSGCSRPGAGAAACACGGCKPASIRPAKCRRPYGATEALPVASIGANEVLNETSRRTDAGNGFCVGRRFPGIQWKVIRIVDGPLASLADTIELPEGEIGELIVRGPVVTDRYVTRGRGQRAGENRRWRSDLASDGGRRLSRRPRAVLVLRAARPARAHGGWSDVYDPLRGDFQSASRRATLGVGRGRALRRSAAGNCRRIAKRARAPPLGPRANPRRTPGAGPFEPVDRHDPALFHSSLAAGRFAA